MNNDNNNLSLKNLIHLSADSNINIFNKRKDKLIIKDKKRILKECESVKKKELKSSSSMLANLAKLNTINNKDSIKEICSNLETKINKIDQVIDCVNNLEDTFNLKIIDISPRNDNNEEVKLDFYQGKFIECYSNY